MPWQQIGQMALNFGLGALGQGQANADAKKAQRKAEKREKKLHKYNIKEAERQRNFQIAQIEQTVGNLQEDARIQLDNLQIQRDAADDITIFNYNTALQARNLLIDQVNEQLEINKTALELSFEEQDNYYKDQSLALQFQGRSDTIDFLDQKDRLDLQKREASESRDFAFRRNRLDQQNLDLRARTQRAEAAFELQSLAIKGLKEAGTAQARGQTGRTAGKTIQGLMAENGAEQARVSEALSLQGQQYQLDIKENIIGLQELNAGLVLENAKIAQASYVLDQKRELDLDQLQSSYESLVTADNFTRKQLIEKKKAADASAKATIPFMPELGPLASDYPLPELRIPEMSYPLEINPPPFLAPIAQSQPNPFFTGLQTVSDQIPGLVQEIGKSFVPNNPFTKNNKYGF